MPDITKTLEELDRLHAEATPGPWKAIDRFGIQGADLTKVHDDRPRSADLIVALHNAYPALRARIAELERKAKAFDTIADRSVTIQPQPASWCVWHVPGAPVFTQTLLEAVETAIEAAIAAKETK